MNPTNEVVQAEQLFTAMKKVGSDGTWLNNGAKAFNPVEGKTPFQNVLDIISQDMQSQEAPKPLTDDQGEQFLKDTQAFRQSVETNLTKVEYSVEGADYNDREDIIEIPDVEDYDHVTEYAHDLFMATSLALGAPNRLNRPAETVDTLQPLVREQILGEIVAAEMMSEYGMPGKMAGDTAKILPDIEMAFAKSPGKFQSLVEDVNSTIAAMRELRAERKANYTQILAEQQKRNQEIAKAQKAAKEEQEKQNKLKNQAEQKAAARQIALITAALTKSLLMRGIWMNHDRKLYPSFYPKGPAISPFNAINLTLHSDANGYRSNLYTTFQEAKNRNEGVKNAEKGVPFNWYNWSKYVNRNNPDDVISRKDYLALSKEEKTQYKGVHNREIRTLFNIDQTMTPVIDPDNYGKALGWNGGEKERNPSASEEQILRGAVDEFVNSISKNLVTMDTNTGVPVASYDMRQDIIRVPSPGSYIHYHDYVHDMVAEVVRATGHSERLAREGAVNQKNPDEMVREELVVELATGAKMLELGMEARLSAQSQKLVPDWVKQLEEDPKMIDIVETDVNNALEVIRKAERGEKIEYTSFVNQQKVRQFQDRQKPQVSATEGLILADIIRHHGMEVPDDNFKSKEEKAQFLEKFGLTYYVEQIQYAKELAKTAEPDVVEAAYSEIYNHAANIDQIARELRPADWSIKGRREIEDSIHETMDADSKEIVIIMDEKSRKADIILPQGAFMGGKATMPNGQVRNFYVTPDEVLCQEEKKDAKIQFNDASGFSKVRIDHALSNNVDLQPSFTRYFNRDGVVGFHADDRYFEGKKLYVANLNQWKLDNIREIDIRAMVEQSRHPNFEKILMMKDDDGRWMLYIQAQDEKPFGVYPDKADVNKYFTATHQGNAAISSAVRMELAAKYYEMAKVKTSIQVNVLGEKASEEDAARLQRVNIFKNKHGQLMIMAKFTDVPKDLPPREITASQWQRLWLSPDHNEYKRDLAAKIFADILHPELKQEETVVQKEEVQQEVKPEDHYISVMRLKSQRPDSLILSRMGDFYQAYQEDARKLSSTLGITLSRSTSMKDSNDNSIEYAMFPASKMDEFLPRLTAKVDKITIFENNEVTEEITRKEDVEENVSHGYHR